MWNLLKDKDLKKKLKEYHLPAIGRRHVSRAANWGGGGGEGVTCVGREVWPAVMECGEGRREGVASAVMVWEGKEGGFDRLKLVTIL